MRTPILTSFTLLFSFASAVFGEERISSSGRAFFETKIRPALVQNCYECHTPDAEKIGGKLLLDTRAGILKGGESGPAIVK